MERRVEYVVEGDPFREVFYLEKSVYDQDGNTVHQINILVGDDYKNIRKTEKLAAELAENECGIFGVYLRKLWQKEEK